MAQKICCGGFNLGEGLKLDPKTKTLNATGGGSGGTQSDWNENNPDASSYVKNRPFYDTGEMVEVDVVPEFVGNFTDFDFPGLKVCADKIFEIKVGEEYSVYWDGTKIDVTCTDFQGMALLGNVALAPDLGAIDTGEPFLYTAIYGFLTKDISTTHTIRVTQLIEKIYQLPYEYLPDKLKKDVAAKTGRANVRMGEVYNDYSGNTADGGYSHAEGARTTASGDYSHAEGESTIASHPYQHVQGSWNETSDKYYLHIVGNGSPDRRSNAHTLDWEGNAWFAGSVEGTSVIVKSSTPGSVKRFRITVDDSGTIKATQI